MESSDEKISREELEMHSKDVKNMFKNRFIKMF